jgi:hypothetical protein
MNFRYNKRKGEIARKRRRYALTKNISFVPGCEIARQYMSEVAKTMLACRFDKYVISEVTCLSEQEIRFLMFGHSIPIEGHTIFIPLLIQYLLAHENPDKVKKGQQMVLSLAMKEAINTMLAYGLPSHIVAYIAGVPEDIPLLRDRPATERERKSTLKYRKEAIKDLYTQELWADFLEESMAVYEQMEKRLRSRKAISEGGSTKKRNISKRNNA